MERKPAWPRSTTGFPMRIVRLRYPSRQCSPAHCSTSHCSHSCVLKEFSMLLLDHLSWGHFFFSLVRHRSSLRRFAYCCKKNINVFLLIRVSNIWGSSSLVLGWVVLPQPPRFC